MIKNPLVAVRCFDQNAAIDLFHLDDVSSGVQIDPVLLHFVGHKPSGLAVKTAQDLSAAVILGGLHTQSVHHPGEFASNVAATDNQDRLGQCIKMEDVV